MTLWVWATYDESPPVKFGGHRNWSSGEIIFLAVEQQDSTCCHLNSPLLFISKEYDLKARDMWYQKFLSCSNTPKETIEEKYTNNFCQTIQKHCYGKWGSGEIMFLVVEQQDHSKTLLWKRKRTSNLVTTKAFAY